MDFLLIVHSHTRWLVAAILLLAILKMAARAASKGEFTGFDRGIVSAAVGLIDLQVLLGIILLIDLGLNQYRIEHGVTMLLAAVAAHLSAIWKKREGSTRARNTLIVLVLSAILIYVGAARLPWNGWTGERARTLSSQPAS